MTPETQALIDAINAQTIALNDATTAQTAAIHLQFAVVVGVMIFLRIWKRGK